ncbi:Gfo/Idh/MocA family oxidoreductase [Pseudoalteromonas shioyasakiensis]|uniref:Gfo/Idh/MocA family protein n=1 Tax=Pseudoalteromonas shioyasakiensis TaxID=1190813 RepID=UPI0021175DD2|nr:Gfo/Idh/MocA family oxidoreductase [Pseudoalteromonas shioyasakiensis]MCQ8877370.1 Gfo/Idh/MocA family oxidoreductase [Pseudoalteromonas shioyasakiensis]
MKRVAVIGLGNISHRHRKNLRALYPKAQIAASSARGDLSTQLPENAEYVYSSLDELILFKPELVIVASPANLHLDHAKRLLETGIPCLIEKPLCKSYDEAKNFLGLMGSLSTPCAVGYCLRYMPTAQKMKELICHQVLGEIFNVVIHVGQYLPDWRKGIDYRDSVSAQKVLGGGALLELSHELDYANWLFGPLKFHHSVLRSSKELGLDVEDLVDVVLSTENGSIINLHLDFLQHYPQRYCTAIGVNGRIHWDLIANTIDVYVKGQDETHIKFDNWQANDMYLDMLKDFESLCYNKNHSTVDLSQAVEVLKLVDKIKLSSQ